MKIYCQGEDAYSCPDCGAHNESSVCVVDHRLDALRGPDHQCYREHTWGEECDDEPHPQPSPPEVTEGCTVHPGFQRDGYCIFQYEDGRVCRHGPGLVVLARIRDLEAALRERSEQAHGGLYHYPDWKWCERPQCVADRALLTPTPRRAEEEAHSE